MIPRIIPCLDIKNGQVVKGKKFCNLEEVGEPLLLAQRYNDELADELIFLDITATNEKRDVLLKLINQVAQNIFIPLTVGGGISTLADMKKIVANGADKISINTSAILTPSLITEGAMQLGSQAIVVAIDVKKEKNHWSVYTHAGQHNTHLDAIQWAKEVESRGAGEILLTSMDSDGLKKGYDLDILSHISSSVNIPVIASGGAGTVQDFLDAIFIGKADALLAASIFHHNIVTITEIKKKIRDNGIPIRL